MSGAQYSGRSLRGALGARYRRLREHVFNTRRVADGPPASRYFLPAGYRYRRDPAYCVPDDPESTIVSQPDVYGLLERLTDSIGVSRIVDLGCGQAGKLVALGERHPIVGVDYGANLEYCRTSFPWGEWVEADLDSPAVGELAARDWSDCAIVCADVLEHLRRPEHLATLIRDALTSAAVAVISTPDRVRTWGPDHAGPPPNTMHVREWERGEFAAWLGSAGLDVAATAYTRSNTQDDRRTAIIAVCVGAGSQRALDGLEASLREAGCEMRGDSTP